MLTIGIGSWCNSPSSAMNKGDITVMGMDSSLSLHQIKPGKQLTSQLVQILGNIHAPPINTILGGETRFQEGVTQNRVSKTAAGEENQWMRPDKDDAISTAAQYGSGKTVNSAAGQATEGFGSKMDDIV